MTDLLDMIWQQAEPLVFITREEFMANLDEWEIEPVEVDGEVAFILLRKGPEFHFISFNTGRPLTLKMGRSWLEPMLARHGHVTTRTPRHAERQHRFNRLVGFRPIGESEFFVHYRLDQPCPSSR